MAEGPFGSTLITFMPVTADPRVSLLSPLATSIPKSRYLSPSFSADGVWVAADVVFHSIRKSLGLGLGIGSQSRPPHL